MVSYLQSKAQLWSLPYIPYPLYNAIMAPTCDLCILVFCIVTAKCTVVCIELVCMDINTFLFMSISRCTSSCSMYGNQLLSTVPALALCGTSTFSGYSTRVSQCKITLCGLSTSALQYKVALCGHCRSSEVAKHSSFADQSESVIDHCDDHDWCPSGIW